MVYLSFRVYFLLNLQDLLFISVFYCLIQKHLQITAKVLMKSLNVLKTLLSRRGVWCERLSLSQLCAANDICSNNLIAQAFKKDAIFEGF